MRKMIIVAALLVVSTLIPYSSSWPLERETHEEINRDAILFKYGIDLDNYLKNTLNIKEGIDTIYFDRYVYDWIALGGKDEDDDPTYRRSLNHFHDPIRSWDTAGLKDSHIGLIFFQKSESSILWGQESSQDLITGNYSWRNAREYYYNALIADSEDKRNSNLADTFYAVGHVMHLVEDSSVPAHVRNDIHMFGYNYEKWVEMQRKLNTAGFVSTYLSSPYYFDPAILNGTPNSLAPIPIAKIIDTDIYTGDNPVVTSSSSIGLSEYANANFFSEGSAMDYKYPALDDVKVCLEEVQEPNYLDDQTTNYRRYYQKVSGGEAIDHLAAISYLYKPFGKYELQDFYDKIIYLDENCYMDYAHMLLPRATGYAAGLLGYFFRGDIDAVDAKTVTTDGKISGITMKVKNNTPNEPMSNGKLVVSYRFKNTRDTAYTYGKSDDVPLASNISPRNDTI